MKKATFIGIVLAFTLVFVFQTYDLYAQHMGRGMMSYDQDVSIPEKLPKPKNGEWVAYAIFASQRLESRLWPGM